MASEWLDRHLVRSVAWTAAAKSSAQVFTWICSLVIARLLSPSDYGLITMAGVFLGLIAIVSEFGVAAVIIYIPDLTVRQVRQVNSLSICVAGIAAAVSCLGGSKLAAFYRQPKIAVVIPVMAVGLLLSGACAVPAALLHKQLRFRLIAAIEVAQSLVQAIVTLVMAYLGAAYWALVIGVLAGSAAATVATLVREHPGLSFPRPSELRQVLRFSGTVLLGNTCWYAYSNSDFTVAGRVLGPAALGAYSIAWNLAIVPTEKIAALIRRVTPAYFARLREDPAMLRQYVGGISKVISLLVFPAATGLALVARDFVAVALGPKWTGVTAPLVFLCVYVAISTPASLFPQTLNSVGKPERSMWTSVIRLAIMPAAFYLGSSWGATGIAIAWVVAYPISSLPLYVWALRAIGMPAGEYARAFLPALLGCAAMAVAVAVSEWFVMAHSKPWLRLSVSGAVGVVTYGIVVAALEPDYLRRMRRWAIS